MSAPRVMRTGALVMVSLMSSDACDMVWLDARQPGQVMMARAYGSSGPMTWQEAHQLGIVLTGMAELCVDDERIAIDTDPEEMREHCDIWDRMATQVMADLQAAHAELEAQS